MRITEKNTGVALSIALLLGGCGGGSSGGGDSTPPGNAPISETNATPVTSSTSSAGSTAVFMEAGVTHALTPSVTTGGTVNLVRLPNAGSLAASLTETQLSTTPIAVSLKAVSGTAVDASHDIGLAYNDTEEIISFFRISTHTEIGTYDTATTNSLQFSGGGGKIVGAVMNPATQRAILATADGFEVIDYSNPNAPLTALEIPSIAMNASNGIEINENFAFHPALKVAGNEIDLIISGGGYDEAGSFPNSMSIGDALELADADTGTIYHPDAATAALFKYESYIDAISVDLNYHVAVLAPEYSTEKVLVDLNQLQLNAANNTFTLPATAVAIIDTGAYKFTNISVESANHLVMMGEGFHGSHVMIAELADPAQKLGFIAITSAPIPMPVSTDNNGAQVEWTGSGDPHGTGAYVTGADHPTKPNTSIGIWASGNGEHIAVIDLRRALNGQLSNGTNYDPTANATADIGYFAVGEQTSDSGSTKDNGPTSGNTTGSITANGGTLVVTGEIPTGFSSSIEFVTAVTDPATDGVDYVWLSNIDPITDSGVVVVVSATSSGSASSVAIIFYDQIGFSAAQSIAAIFSTDCSSTSCPTVDTVTKKITFTNVSLAATQPVGARQNTGDVTISGTFSY